MSKTILNSLRHITQVGVILIFTSIPVLAQFSAALQGKVTDPSGADVPGATVTVTNKLTKLSRTTTTTGTGVYAVSGLTPGDYTVRVEKRGFKAGVLQSVQIATQGTQAANVQLAIGSQTQSVTVTAPVTTLINTQSATLSGTLTAKEIQLLPSIGRDPFQLARLMPGVTGDDALNSSGAANDLPGNSGPGGSGAANSIFQTENQVQISANGTRTTSSNIMINGVGINSVTWGGAATITPNEGSVQSVKISTNNYSALYGRNDGAQIIITSQNGTNQYHGSAFFKWDRPGLNAYQAWNGPNNAPTLEDTNRFNQFGGSLGGPIIHNKLFGFFSYETLRDQSVNTALGWYETPQFLSMAPSGSIASKILTYPGEGASYTRIVPEPCSFAGITNPSMCQPVDIGGKYAGLNVGSPLTTPLGTADPTYVSPGDAGVGNGLNGIPDVMYAETSAPVSDIDAQYNYRIDFQPGQKDLLSFTQYWVPVTDTSYNGPVRAANLWHHHSINHAETGVWNHTFSPTLLNQARFGASGWYWNEINTNPQEPWGLPEGNIDEFGAVNLSSSGNYFGAPGPSVFDQVQYNANDTMTKVLNSHMLEFGGDVTWLHYLSEVASAARPQYDFRNLWDFLNDAPYAESGNFDPMTGQPTAIAQQIRSEDYAFFAQDNYKMKSNLTLTLGLRWEYFGPIHAVANNIANPVLASFPDPLTDLSMKLGGNLYSTSPNNWAPDVGFAWSPKSVLGRTLADRFVLRGGFGTAYDLTEEAITVAGSLNPPFVSSDYLTGSNILYSVPSNVHQFSDWPTDPATIETFSPTTHLPVSGAPVSLTEIQNNMPTPVTYHYSLEAQYEFSPSWVATLGYEGSQTRHYTIQNNLDWLYRPLNPRVNGLTYYYNGANAEYDALLASVNHPISHTFNVDAQYTWDRSLDDGSNDYYIDDYPLSPAYAFGPSDYNVGQQFKLWGTWSPNFFASRRGLLGKLLGGWEMSGIFEVHSGFPWTPIYSNTSCNVIFVGSNWCSLRPADYTGGALTSYNNTTFMSPGGDFPKTALSYFGVPSFQMGPAFPASGPIPSAPGVTRNSFTGPGYRDFDAMLGKTFGMPKMKALGEDAQIELRADFFNLFNTLNLVNPGIDGTSNVISFNGTTSSPTFGQSLGALGARVIELTARFSF
jgi:Carboxypeptidase regulatory-like domain/TonB dependent receptor